MNKLSKSKIKYLLPIIILIIIVLIDYLTKLLIINNIIYNEKVNIIGEFIKITFKYNNNIIFGLNFGLENTIIKFIINSIIYIILIIILIVFYNLIKKEKTFPRICFGMLLGGITGNIINIFFGDIIFFGKLNLFFGKIIDWISIEIPNFTNLPLFNLSDTFITISTILLLIYIITHKQSDVFKSLSKSG